MGKLEVVLTNIGTEPALAALAQLRESAAAFTGYGTDKANSAAGRKAFARVKSEQAATVVTEPEATEQAVA